MPNRTIREGFLDSESVNELTAHAECLYHRLLLGADDAGRFDGRPIMIASRLFPLKVSLRVSDVEEWLAECVKSNLVRIYDRNGQNYLQLAKVQKYGKSLTSKYPDEKGGFGIEYVKQETRDGVKEFVKSSLWDAHPMRTPCAPHADRVPKNPTITNTGTNTKEELNSSPKEKTKEKESSSPGTTGGRLPPLSAYYSEPPAKKQTVPSESSTSSSQEKEEERNPEEIRTKARPTFRGKPSGGTPGAQERIWIASGKSKEEYDKRTKPPLPELNTDDTECLKAAGIDMNTADLWYYRRAKALIGGGKFSELCHVFKGYRKEGKKAKKSYTCWFVDYLNKEVAK